MNTYTTLDAVKSPSALDIQHDREDERILAVIEAVSRQIDGYCGRSFYIVNATRLFDCDGDDGSRTLFTPDLVSIDADGLATDDDGDGAFETVWPDADFELHPPNAAPAGGGDRARPHHAVRVASGSGWRFPSGSRRTRIAGQWGFWRRLRTASETLSGAVDAERGEIAVSGRADVCAGHTLLIGSEQLYVRSVSAPQTFQVERGVNGTTATAHGSGDAIRVFEYPAPIREAATIQAARTWRGEGAALGTDLRATLRAYRRITF